jgi:hypothetical protein
MRHAQKSASYVALTIMHMPIVVSEPRGSRHRDPPRSLRDRDYFNSIPPGHSSLFMSSVEITEQSA